MSSAVRAVCALFAKNKHVSRPFFSSKVGRCHHTTGALESYARRWVVDVCLCSPTPYGVVLSSERAREDATSYFAKRLM